MIFRTVHDVNNRFFLFSRATAQNKNLSFEARGVLAYLLSKPDKWECMLKDIMHEGELSKYEACKIVRELKDNRYLVASQDRDEDGKFTRVVYDIFETPAESVDLTDSDWPDGLRDLCGDEDSYQSADNATLNPRAEIRTTVTEHEYQRKAQSIDKQRLNPRAEIRTTDSKNESPRIEIRTTAINRNIEKQNKENTERERERSTPPRSDSTNSLPDYLSETISEGVIEPTISEIFRAICAACLLGDPEMLRPIKYDEVQRTETNLTRRGATAEMVHAAVERWYASDWRGRKGEPPTPNQLVDEWAKLTRETAKPEPKANPQCPECKGRGFRKRRLGESSPHVVVECECKKTIPTLTGGTYERRAAHGAGH